MSLSHATWPCFLEPTTTAHGVYTTPTHLSMAPRSAPFALGCKRERPGLHTEQNNKRWECPLGQLARYIAYEPNEDKSTRARQSLCTLVPLDNQMEQAKKKGAPSKSSSVCSPQLLGKHFVCVWRSGVQQLLERNTSAATSTLRASTPVSTCARRHTFPSTTTRLVGALLIERVPLPGPSLIFIHTLSHSALRRPCARIFSQHTTP